MVAKTTGGHLLELINVEVLGEDGLGSRRFCAARHETKFLLGVLVNERIEHLIARMYINTYVCVRAERTHAARRNGSVS